MVERVGFIPIDDSLKPESISDKNKSSLVKDMAKYLETYKKREEKKGYKMCQDSLPKETQEYIEDVWKYMVVFKFEQHVQVHIDNDVYNYIIDRDNNKVTLLFLLAALRNNKAYSDIVDKLKLNDFRYLEKASSYDLKNTYSSVKFDPDIFFKNLKDPFSLGPIQILYNYVKDFSDTNFIEDIASLYSDTFKSKLKTLAEDEKKELLNRTKKLNLNFLNGLDIDMIDYIETFSKIYVYLRDNNVKIVGIEADDEYYLIIASLLALYHYRDVNTDLNIKHYIMQDLSKAHLDEKRLFSILSIDKIDSLDDVIYKPFCKLFFENIFKHRRLEKIEDFLELLLNSDVQYKLYKILNVLEIDDDIYKNLIYDIRNARKKNVSEDEILEYYKKIGPELADFLEFSTKTYDYLKNVKDFPNDFDSIVTNYDDLSKLAMLIASYHYKTNIALLFEDNGITLRELEEYLGVELSKEKIFETPLDKKRLYRKYHFNARIVKFDIETVSSLLKSSYVTHSTCIIDLFAKYTGVSNEDELNDKFEMFLEHRRLQEQKDIAEGKILALRNAEIPSLTVDDNVSLMSFGNDLFSYSSEINSEYDSILSNDRTQSSIDSIKELISNVYEKKEVEEIKRNRIISFILSLFRRNRKIATEERTFNPDAIVDLKSEIDRNIEKLNSEIVSYDYLKRFISAYIAKLDAYYEEAFFVLEGLKETPVAYTRDSEYSQFLDYQTNLTVLEDKVETFRIAKESMKQELLRVHLAIRSHYTTIKALRLSKDVVLPLIGSEALINAGNETEREALEIPQNLINLFNNILEKNVEATYENLERIKSANFANVLTDKMVMDVELYLKDVKNEQEDDIKGSLALLDQPKVLKHTDNYDEKIRDLRQRLVDVLSYELEKKSKQPRI